MAKLQEAFRAVNVTDSAMHSLALLWQGNRPVEAMIMDFRLLVGEVGLSMESISDQIHLIKMFMNCINPQLKKKKSIWRGCTKNDQWLEVITVPHIVSLDN